jgi:NAD(P)-dependent dehydrogenase (short-subunit alcohol dehydrogenase family)
METVRGGPGERAAIVTGVSRGLGAALGGELLDRGFTVLGIGRASNPGLTSDRNRFVHCDLADSAGIDTTLAPTLEGLKDRRPVSVRLLNNAATVGGVGPLGRPGQARSRPRWPSIWPRLWRWPTCSAASLPMRK